MKIPPVPANEPERQKAVESLNILDTLPETRFDRLTKEAAEHFKLPISTLSIIDKDREWFKSRVGLDETEGGRAESFCGHTIAQGLVFVVEDTHKDERFADNPMVTGKPYIRFYAGVTLHDRKTHQPVGAFCIKDTKPRELSADELDKLMELAKSAEDELNKGEGIGGG